MFSYVIIEDVLFEVEEEQSFEEIEPRFLGEEGKWNPPCILFCTNHKHVITL
jgi:hypothetical protein